MPGNQIDPWESAAAAGETFEAGVRSEISSVGVAAVPSGTAKRISAGMLLLGVGLLWPVPLGGVLFLVAGGFGLAIASESELTRASYPTANPAVVVPAAGVGTPFDPRPEGFPVI